MVRKQNDYSPVDRVVLGREQYLIDLTPGKDRDLRAETSCRRRLERATCFPLPLGTQTANTFVASFPAAEG